MLHYQQWSSQSFFFQSFGKAIMYGCESWTINKTEHQRIDAFELWCWRRPLRVPWTARWSNQSILKEINPEYSLEGLMLKLKFQYFGHLMQSTGSLEKTLMLGKIEGRRRRGQQSWDGCVASPTQWTWVWASSGRWRRTVKPGMLQSMRSQSRTWLSEWTTAPLPYASQSTLQITSPGYIAVNWIIYITPFWLFF